MLTTPFQLSVKHSHDVPDHKREYIRLISRRFSMVLLGNHFPDVEGRWLYPIAYPAILQEPQTLSRVDAHTLGQDVPQQVKAN